MGILFFFRLKDLRQYVKKRSSEKPSFWNRAAGAYVALDKGKHFGLICLWDEIVGAGYFAHELQHFILDYMARRIDVNDTEANEHLAWMAGDMTAQFWTEYYKLHPEKNGN